MTAGEALAGANLLTPELRVVFHPIPVDKVKLRVAPEWLLRVLGRQIQGVTYGRFIFIDGEVLAGEPRRLGLLVVHELTHYRQWIDGGIFGFTVPYVWEYLKGRMRGLSHRDAYRANPFEVEARAVADRFR